MVSYGMDEEEEARQAMRAFAHEVTLPKGTVLVHGRVYYLIEGVCSLTCISKEGEEFSFMYFKKGMLLNYIPTVMMREKVYTGTTQRRFHRLHHSITTKTECRLLSCGGDVFLQHLKDNLVLYKLLSHSLTENWVNLLSVSTGICASPAGARVCQFILDTIPPSPPYILPRYLTYPEIAGHLSLHSITVTKIFRALREQGILTKNGSVSQVSDYPRLLAFAREQETFAY